MIRRGCINYTELGRFASLDPVVAHSHIVNNIPGQIWEIIADNVLLLSLINDADTRRDLIAENIEAEEILKIYSKEVALFE